MKVPNFIFFVFDSPWTVHLGYILVGQEGRTVTHMGYVLSPVCKADMVVNADSK